MIDILRFDPCAEGANGLAAQPDARTAWESCSRSDWMIWLLRKVFDVDDKRFRLAACDIAESVLHLVAPGEDRPRIAIETARGWLAGTATLKELDAAVRGARAAADDAYSTAAAAAYAAANAADAAADAYSAAAAGYPSAGYPSAYAAAATAYNRKQRHVNCDILRKHFDLEAVLEALT